MTVDSLKDNSGNISYNIKSYFQTTDTEPPFLTSTSVIDSQTISVVFNEDVLNIDANDESNYELFLSNSTFQESGLDIINAASTDTNVYELKVEELEPDSDYTLRIIAISDEDCNFETSEFEFNSSVSPARIHIEYTNQNDYEVTTVARTIVPFDQNAPPPQQNPISFYNFSLEDEAGNPQVAEFITRRNGPGGNITELLVITAITVPPNGTVSRYLSWGLGTSVPSVPEFLATESMSAVTRINNRNIKFSLPKNSTSPASNVTFSNSTRPILRQSLYEIKINNQKYDSRGLISGFTENQQGSVWRDYSAYTNLGPLTLEYYLDTFLSNNKIEIETVLKNESNFSINISDLKLSWPITGTPSSYYYTGGIETEVSRGQNSGFEIYQNNINYNLIKDKSDTLSTINNDYDGWLALLSSNARWYMAVVPGKIQRQDTRTIGIVEGRIFDNMLNQEYQMNPGESLSFTTIILIGEAPVNEFLLSTVGSSLNTDVFDSGVTQNYLDFIGKSGQEFDFEWTVSPYPE